MGPRLSGVITTGSKLLGVLQHPEALSGLVWNVQRLLTKLKAGGLADCMVGDVTCLPSVCPSPGGTASLQSHVWVRLTSPAPRGRGGHLPLAWPK